MGLEVSEINLALFPADQVNMYGAAHIWNCKNCGKQYYNDRHRFNGEGEQYCSKACAYAHRRGIHHASYTTKSMSPLLTLYYRPCEWCGVLLKHTGSQRRFCSRQHRLLQERIDCYQRTSQKKIIKSSVCGYCKKSFTSAYGDKRKGFCSRRCGKNYYRVGKTHIDRAKHYGVHFEHVNKVKVFERDGWHCQLCGIATPRRLLSGKRQSRSPELDHIIPLSQGGSHSYDNTQCACSKCNQSKNNKALGQLWIAGFAAPIKRNNIKRVGASNLQKNSRA
jgi:hypothetical protein